MNEIDKFISSIDNTLYNRIRQSKSDAECRRYLKEHLLKQLTLQVVGGTCCFDAVTWNMNIKEGFKREKCKCGNKIL